MAEKSLFLDTSEDGKSAAEEMMQAVIQDPVLLRLNFRVYEESEVATAVFAFRVYHMTADGVGASILAVRFFRFLAH